MRFKLFAVCVALALAGCSASGDAAKTETTVVAPVVTLIPVEKDVAVAPAQANAGSPVIGGIDGVSSTLRATNRLLVVGWAVDLQYGSPVTRVDVVLDGKTSVQAELGDERPDVVTTLNRADARLSGWVAQFDIKDIPNGEHTITVLVYDTKQQAHILPFSYALQVSQ